MSIIQNIQNFNAQTAMTCFGPSLKRGHAIFSRGDGLLLKNWTLSSSLSLFLVKYSFLNLFLVLVCMQFLFKCHYIHMSRQRKASYELFYGNVQKTHNMKTLNAMDVMDVMDMSWKLCMQRKFWKFSIFITFSNTRFILKSLHFIWSQLQHRMKRLNDILEFNSSKNTPQVWTFLSNNVQRFSTMQYHFQTHHHCYFLLWFLWPQKQGIFGRIQWFSKKTEHYENPLFQHLSLFQTLSSKWNNWYQSCSCSLFICISEFRISTFIWEERTRYKNSSETEYFTLDPRQYPKILLTVTLWKHSLNVVKCWALWNTWKSL